MKLGNVLKKWRLHQELTIRALAAEIGISGATLCRIEDGRALDGETLMKVFNWLCEKTGEKDNGGN